MLNARLYEAQAGIKSARRNINKLGYADDTTLKAESEEELKSFLMKMREESEKAGLKLNIKKTKIMASSPMTLWQRGGKKVETVTDFIFLCSKLTADGDCSHEIKRCLLLERKDMASLASILKSRDITLLTKVHEVKAKGFPGGASKERAFQCRRWKRCGFDPWVGKIPLEEGVATHSSVLTWRILWIEELDGP